MYRRQWALIAAFGLIIGFTAMSRNSAVAILGLVPTGFLVGALAAARGASAVSDVGRAIVYGLAALLIGSAFVGLVYLLAQSYSPLQTLGVSLRMVQIIWVGGGLIVGFWFLLGLIVRALK